MDPVKEHSLIFSAPMILALLEGRKTQTRRVARLTPEQQAYMLSTSKPDGRELGWCPYGSVGGAIWVRETFSIVWPAGCDDGIVYDEDHPDGRPIADRECSVAYRATGDTPAVDEETDREMWKPSIHMPRWASRLTLTITALGLERLCSITEEDAIAEGVEPSDEDRETHPQAPHVQAYYRLWDKLNGDRAPWIENPFVWAISFPRIGRPA